MVGHIDRISNLPSNVIDGILQHLSIRDVVRTSILSRKWRHMWVSVPRLDFGLDFFDICYDRDYEERDIPSIITEILLLHNGPVSKFTLEIPEDYSIEITCLSKWILFLSKCDIKYLELMIYGSYYEMSSHLFSCQGLIYLKLGYLKFLLSPSFCGFKNLLELHLNDIAFESDALERLISGCLVLQVLTISLCWGFDCIHVSAPSLKALCIEGGEDIKSICFKKAKNLIDLTLIMESHGINFEQVNFSDFIKCLPKIERLCLRGKYYIKMLSTGINMQKLQNSVNLKYLELDGVDFNQSREILSIVSLLKSSSILVQLVIKSSSVAEAPLPEHVKELLYCNSCCLSQLRKVNITVGTAYEHALDLIRFLLANSSSLEILTFKVGLGLKQSDTPTILRISRDLLHLGRASQRAEVEFLYDGLTEQ